MNNFSWSTKQQVAERYQVSSRTVDNWMSDQKLPYFKTGNVVRFSNEHLQALEKRALINGKHLEIQK